MLHCGQLLNCSTVPLFVAFISAYYTQWAFAVAEPIARYYTPLRPFAYSFIFLNMNSGTDRTTSMIQRQ